MVFCEMQQMCMHLVLFLFSVIDRLLYIVTVV